MFAGFTKGIVYMMGRFGGESINRIHHDTEFIINTGKIPPEWQTRYEKEREKLEKNGGNQQAAARLVEREYAKCIRRIEKLLLHFHRTSIVSDEEARGLLIQGLSAARETWLEKSWEEIRK